jgi:hypothetical protein
MSVENYEGQPIDKLHFVTVADIPAKQNQVQGFPVGDDGGVSKQQGKFWQQLGFPSLDHELTTAKQDPGLIKKWWLLAAAGAVVVFFLMRGSKGA